MSRFLLSNMGSRGDIQVFIDLGRALHERGHAVVVATAALHRDLIESHDLACAELSSTTAEEQTRQIARLIDDPDDVPRATAATRDYLIPLNVQVHAAIKALSEHEQFDGVIVSESSLLYTATTFESKCTMVVVHYSPPDYRRYDPFAFPKMLAMSPTILQPPAWLDDWWMETGFFEPAARTATLPVEVEQFLADGSPPVFITLGSMCGIDGRHFGDMIVDAIGATGLRAIIQRGFAGIQPSSVPRSVLMVGEVPYAALFPRVSCVVLHGGSGTTAAVARAGVPAIFLPHLPDRSSDQWTWGSRFESLGAGAMLPPRQLTAAQLAPCLLRATKDPGVIMAARELGAKVRAEGDGVSKACDAIEAQIRDFSGSQRAWSCRDQPRM